MMLMSCIRCKELSMTEICAVCDTTSANGGWMCEHCGEGPNEKGSFCRYCSLTKGVTYTSATLAFLWKKDSQIQRFMKDNRESLGSDRAIGQFLRKKCGPHCIKAVDCHQSLANLLSCHNKNRKKGAGEAPSGPIIHLPAIISTTRKGTAPKTHAAFAAAGWLSNMYEDSHRKQTEGSGAAS